MYPLGLCSLVGLFIIFERLYALRRQAVVPDDLVDAIIQGQPARGGDDSVLARILSFAEVHRHDEGAVRAFGRLEVNRMERGFVFLEIIVGAAPLLGLLGTVTGLVKVFSNISPETGSARSDRLYPGYRPGPDHDRPRAWPSPYPALWAAVISNVGSKPMPCRSSRSSSGSMPVSRISREHPAGYAVAARRISTSFP